jgi:chitinase
MTASTTTVSGIQRTVVTLRVNSVSTNAATASGTGAMTWTPSASATDLAGNPMSTTVVTETGTADRDF